MGKFSDKILGAFSFKDDDEYDDEFEDEEFDDEYEDEEDDAPVEPKKNIFSGLKNKQRPAASRPAAPARERAEAPVYSAPPRKANQEVCIFKPSSIEDSREITETLLQGKAVVINFEGLHVELSQRIIDFISGSCYALDGNLQKISNFIFIATPETVDISGDFQELLNGGNDISGFKSPLI